METFGMWWNCVAKKERKAYQGTRLLGAALTIIPVVLVFGALCFFLGLREVILATLFWGVLLGAAWIFANGIALLIKD